VVLEALNISRSSNWTSPIHVWRLPRHAGSIEE
jgi:hypothetical protein